MASGERLDAEDVLAVFSPPVDPAEPLTVGDVADATNGDRADVCDRLRSLTEGGHLATKRIGGHTQVWWRPPSTSGRPTGNAGADTTETFTSGHDGRIRLERILEASPVSVIVVDPAGEISFANGRAAETLDLDRDDIEDRTYDDPEWDIYYEDGTPIPTDEHPVTRVLETGDSIYGFEHWLRRSDGTERWLSSNSAPVVNDDSEVEYVVVGLEDTTQLKDREEKLTSDECRMLELVSDELFEPFLEAADGDLHIQVDDLTSLPDGTSLQYVTVTGLSPNRVTEIFDRRASVLAVRLLESVTDTCRLELHVDGPTVPLVFDELGGTVTSLLRKRADQRAVLVGDLPGNVTPRTAIQAARAVHPDIELRSQKLRYSPRLLSDHIENALTERQLAALRTAYYGGHFDTPRTSTGDELADKLGITRQTFHHHLRKAERTVFNQLFERSPDVKTD